MISYMSSDHRALLHLCVPLDNRWKCSSNFVECPRPGLGIRNIAVSKTELSPLCWPIQFNSVLPAVNGTPRQTVCFVIQSPPRWNGTLHNLKR